MTAPKLKPAAAPTEPGDRRQEILAIAARLFARRGYNGVSVREIAEAAGILGGSLYHHFASKKQIYLEAHGAALDQAAARIRAAFEGVEDPWERLKAAIVEHVSINLSPDSVTIPLMDDLPALPGDMRVEIIAQRDEFELMYKQLIAALPLRPQVDRDIYRVSLIALMNTLRVWYRPGRLTPVAIAEQVAEIFRHPAKETDQPPASAEK